MPLIQYGQFEPSFETYTRITEGSDTRITEGSDTRITNEEVGNTGVTSLVAQPTLKPLASQPYVNVGGVWKLFVPYVKYNGVWQQPNAIYKKVSGNWKRVY
jgi:hypothetical protein